MSKIEAPVHGYTRLHIEPYTPNIGATLHDIDLANLADDTLRAELKRALAQYQVLFIRNQSLTPDQHVALARVFGDPDKAKAFFPRHPAHKEIELIEAQPDWVSYGNGTDQWHADITFSDNPPIGTILYAQTIPPSGGDTLWASASAVYEALPAGIRSYLETLEAQHSFENSGWPQAFLQAENGEAFYRKARAEYLPVTHPVIRTHPLTGKKLVYVNPNFTDRIKGLPRQQSDALLAWLFAFFQRPEFQARLRWAEKTVAIWDNRSTVHYAVRDYGSAPRKLHRVTFGEDSAF